MRAIEGRPTGSCRVGPEGGIVADISRAHRLGWYRQMLTIRRFEERIIELFLSGDIDGGPHVCSGEEAISVGSMAAMRQDDVFTCTYRGHGHALARGMPLDMAFGELLGRATGGAGGVGGSMHLIDFGHGHIGANAIVGAGLPIAVGAATAFKMRGEDRVALTFFGDGATNIGTFHEALNMASAWRAPVVFVLENNLYGEWSRFSETTAIEDLAVRAGSYGIPGIIVDGQDVDAVHNAVRAAIERASAGDGPTLLEMKTYRYRGHSRADPGRYRPADELERWKARDPIELLGAKLEADGLLTAEQLAAMRVEVQAEIDAAAGRALAAPYLTLEETADYVYAD